MIFHSFAVEIQKEGRSVPGGTHCRQGADTIVPEMAGRSHRQHRHHRAKRNVFVHGDQVRENVNFVYLFSKFNDCNIFYLGLVFHRPEWYCSRELPMADLHSLLIMEVTRLRKL